MVAYYISSGGDVYSSFPTLLLCLVSPVTVSLPFLFPSPAQPSPAQLSSHSLESLHLHPSPAQHTRAGNEVFTITEKASPR